MSKQLIETLGNEEWLRKNEASLKAMLPATWTHIENLQGVQMAYRLKLLGVDWRSTDEFGKVMVYLETIGIMLREGLTVKANPRSIFDGK